MPIKKFLISLSSNLLAQRLLERNIQLSQYLMGIGAGGNVTSSGEARVFSLMMTCLRPPLCIFDVGANKGQYVSAVQKAMGPTTYHLHCFEPNKVAYNALHQAYQAFSNIKINQCAMGDRKRFANLYFDKPGSTLASLSKRRLRHLSIDFNQYEKIQIDTLDNYCSLNAIERIHLLKLDVEGHELAALRGAQDILTKKAIDIISFEFGGCNIDSRTFFQDFYYMLSRQFGMNIYRITPSGYLRHIDHYQEIHEQFRTTNFIAAREDLPI